MPKKFDDMVSAIKASLKKDNPSIDDKVASSKAYAMATAQWKKMHGGKLPGEKVKDWRILEFFVPILETRTVGNDFIVKGVAINETTTRNGIKYVASELENAAPTFRNKPILLDHRNEIKSIVGRTTNNVIYNSMNKRIEFEAKVMDKDIQQMINDGRITDVSIGASVKDLIESKEEGSRTAVGLEGHEISFVAVPGDPNANLAMALDNSFMIKEAYGDLSDEEDKEEDEIEEKSEVVGSDDLIKLNGGIKMAEEGETKEPEVEAKPEEEVKTEDASERLKKVEAELAEMKKEREIAILTEMIRNEEKVKYEAKLKEMTPPAVKEVAGKEKLTEDKTKGEISEKIEEKISSDSLVLEKADTGKGFQIYRDFSKENSGKFKRLIRN